MGGVEQIAADVGIPVELVRAAARSLEPRPTPAGPPPEPAEEPPKKNWFLGAPTRLVFERVVDGELPEPEFPLLVDEVRRVLRNVGQVSHLGRSFAWTMVRTGGSTRSVEVVVAVRGGVTRIAVQEPLGNLIGGVYGGIGGGMGGGGAGPLIAILTEGLGMADPVIAVAVPLWLAAALATARTVYYYAVRQRSRELERLAGRLAALTRDLAVTPAGSLPNPGRPALPPP
jgi:hypothetical protein